MSDVSGRMELRTDEVPETPQRPWYRKKRYLIPIMFVVWMIAIGAIFGDPSPERILEGEPVAADAAQDRCEAVDPFVMSAIAEGLLNPEEARLSGGQAVRSRAFESLWFVATGVEASGVDDDAVLLWAVDRNAEDVRTIFAVNDLADELSMWGDVVVPEDPPRPGDDGAAAAQQCVG